MSILQANSSVTHTYGNVACIAMDYVQKFFEPDYFKKVHISTKLAHRQLNIYKTNLEFWKLHKPILLMRPRIEVVDNSKWFYGAAATNRMTNITSPMEFGDTIELLKDRKNGNKLDFIWNRAKIYYDVVIIVDSFNEQLNVANYLSNAIIPDTPFLLPTALESYVPKHIIYRLADNLGIPRDNTADILLYLNTHGHTPFTYKYKNGSGNDEFFSLYNTNIEMISSELSLDDGSTKGMVAGNFTLSFTLSCEFNMMACYYLFIRDNDDRYIRCPHNDIEKDAITENLFTIPLLYKLDLEPGWKLYAAPAFFVDGKEDSINLNEIMTEDLISIMNFQRKRHFKEDTLIRFRVFRNRCELENGVDFIVDNTDLNNITLTVKECNPKVTYRLFVIINNAYIHSLEAEFLDFNKET